jgi:flavin-dependent dehydrogenase
MIRKKEGVVVVGASAAGLFAAYQLARAGVRVRVYDAEPELSPDARTLIVTPAWLKLLDFDVEETVLNRTRTFELISRGASARIPLREPDVILERVAFLRLLARKVQEAGGELIMNHHIEAVREDTTAPLLHFRNGHGLERMTASTVLGADGVHSVVAEEVDRDGIERVAISQARVELPVDLARDTVRCWFDRESTRFFYWLIPESDQTGAVGLIADTEAEAREALERFMGAHDMEPIEYQEAWVPMYPWCSRPSVTLGEGRVLLLGDAAGHVKVTTVGGVVTGMRGGAAAARSILRGTSYARELRPLHWELRAHALVRRMLDGFSDEDYDRLLELLNHRASRILSHYNRDELTRALWRLIPAQPQWLLLGARALIAQV